MTELNINKNIILKIKFIFFGFLYSIAFSVPASDLALSGYKGNNVLAIYFAITIAIIIGFLLSWYFTYGTKRRANKTT